MSNARNLARLIPNSSGVLPESVVSTVSASKINGQLTDINMAAGSIIQVVITALPPTYISVPAYGNDRANFRQWGTLSSTITTKSANSRIAILVSSTIHSSVGSHCYFDIKRNGNWISGYDGAYADHHQAGYSNGLGLTFVDSPNVPAGTVLTYTYWGGDWSAGQISINAYGNDTGNRNGDQDGQVSIWEIK